MKNILEGWFENQYPDEIITIVSGLPRSGTSLMMRMLEVGGLQPLTDDVRKADLDNPHGYYEFEPVKKLYRGETSWLPEARGKVVKIIAPLLPCLPADYDYRVIFVHRDPREILASQKVMLVHRGEDPGKVRDEELARIFVVHLAQVSQWMADHPRVHHITVSYNCLMGDPLPEIARLNAFLGWRLDEKRMVSVIDANLYRQRSLAQPIHP